VAEGTDFNFPYVNCKGLSSGKCLNSFTGFEQLYIDCEGTGAAVCDSTIQNGVNLVMDESTINVKASTGAKATCINAPYCFIDCEGADSCSAVSRLTNMASYPLVT